MIVGLTGTRNGMTTAQRAWFEELLLITSVTELHHGGCVGADHDGHQVGVALGIPVVVHPPRNTSLTFGAVESDAPAVRLRAPLDYLARDRHIVWDSSLLVGFPDGPPRPRSGTWYTIDYAVRSGVRTLVCAPDGTAREAVGRVDEQDWGWLTSGDAR